jgi:nitrile hydratase subunit alpha
VDKVLGYFKSEMTPLNGQKVVARAWTDPDFALAAVPASTDGSCPFAAPAGDGSAKSTQG